MFYYLAVAQVLGGDEAGATESLRRIYERSPESRVENERTRMKFYDTEAGGEAFIRGWHLLEKIESNMLATTFSR